jgi:hypothetical protein
VRKKEVSDVTDLGPTEFDASADGAASTAIEKVDEGGEQNTQREQGVFADSKSSCKSKEEEQDATVPVTENELQKETSSESEDDPDTTTSPESGIYIMVAQREPLDQLKSQQFILLTTFFVFHSNRSDWVLTTA